MSLQKSALQLLDAVGDRLGINTRYFSSQGGIVLIAHTITILYGIVISYLTTLLFTQDALGMYKFALSIVGFLGVLKLSGLATSIAKDLNQHETSPLLHTARQYFLLLLGLSALILLSIPVSYYFGRGELWSLLTVAAVLVPLEAMALTFSSGLITGKSLFALSLRYSVVAKLIMLVVNLLVFAVYPSPTLLLASTLLTNIVVYGHFCVRLIPKYTNHEHSNRIFGYGFKLSLASVPVTIVWYVDSFLIAGTFGLGQLAVFYVATLIPEQFKKLFKELLAVTFSRQASGKDTWARRKKLALFSVGGMVPVVLIFVAYCFVAQSIFNVLFPLYDDPNTVFLSKVALATLLIITWNIIPQYLEAHGYLHQIRRINALCAGAFLICMLILIPQYGLLGAIISRGIFRLVFVGSSMFYLLTPPRE